MTKETGSSEGSIHHVTRIVSDFDVLRYGPRLLKSGSGGIEEVWKLEV